MYAQWLMLSPSMPWAVRILLYVLGVIAAVQMVLPVLLLSFKNSLLFFPSANPAESQGLPALAGLDAKLFVAKRPDGRALTGFDARPQGGSDEPVLLYFHGNGGNAAQRAPLLRSIVESTKLRVVLASYSGYGTNSGSPSEADLYLDALAFHDALTQQGVDAARIVLYGESIGGAPALYAATERPCAGVILQSTLSSLSSMAGNVYPWLPLAPYLTRGLFPNAERVAALKAPTLIVHGRRDGVVPFSEAEELRSAAPSADLLAIPNAGHNDVFEAAGPAYFSEIAHRVRSWTTTQED